MTHHSHHHHHRHEHEEEEEEEDDEVTWKNDLFEVKNTRLYCFNLFCPCVPIYDLYVHIVGGDPHHHKKTSHLGPTTGALSCLTCFVPSCLAANELVRRCIGRKEGSGDTDYFASQGSATWGETAEAALPMLSLMQGSLPSEVDSELLGKTEENMQGASCLCMMMGTMCLVPSVFMIRQAVESQMDHDPLESIWQTGLISLFAWPCALTQMQEEIAEHHTHK